MSLLPLRSWQGDAMGVVIKLSDYRFPWREILKIDSTYSTMIVYVNDQTQETEIVQFNDDYESIRTQLSATDASLLAAALTMIQKKQERT